jgi:hypothetical protein
MTFSYQFADGLWFVASIWRLGRDLRSSRPRLDPFDLFEVADLCEVLELAISSSVENDASDAVSALGSVCSVTRDGTIFLAVTCFFLPFS